MCLAKDQDRSEEIIPLTDELRNEIESLYKLMRPIAMKIDPENGEELAHGIIVKIIPLLQEGHMLGDWEQKQQKGWLRTTLRNAHISSIKRANRVPPLSARVDENKYGYALASIEDDEQYQPYNVQVKVLEEQILRELGEIAEDVLTENQLDIFEERLRGLSYEEIAKNTGRKAAACRKSMKEGIRPKMLCAFEARGLI